MRAEAAVDRPQREAVGLQRELQRGDVPPARAGVQRAAADRMAAQRAERSARLRADDAVGGRARAALKRADAGCRPRPGEPVDAPA